MNHLKDSQSNRAKKFGRTSIFIIEDNPDHTFLIRRALEECMPGILAMGFSNRQSALDTLPTRHDQSKKTTLPSLILLDLYLPTRNEGLMALKDLKNYFLNQDQPPVPVVVFSYSNHQEDINLCYRHGANAYLVKSTDHHDWVSYFSGLRDFWLETVALPPNRSF
jgi:CheY-like chemotaxis protein